ncbi:mechanosensitive ion channel family protein [Ancylobacter polymorphus]|uniref:Small-conductance mechanosensitive channel n=1 Tax=Ancylobacter polymorphus TaxID=223390 RepID=A0ABU0BHA1_9HYPH|nr:mechanosensitive ion channel domain-containing protein [Ancylobacter polymorphus]MDQ0305223.1 small conductance mechanosensitive channel [Ancylobacter polymorphus]
MDLDSYRGLNGLGDLIILYGLNMLYALALLVIGWWLASVVDRLVTRALNATHRVDPTIVGFLSSLARYTVLVFVGLAVLQRFGIQTTSLIAVLGATSLAVGLALQGTLSNVAAGVMLLLFRPFKVGDSVEVGGQSGTVKAITLFTTELAAGDNVQVLMPNGRVWGSPMVNRSVYGARSFSFALELKPDDDIEGVMEKGLTFLKNDPRVTKEPGPSASIAKMALDRVEIGFSGWAASGDAGGVRGDLIKRLREAVRAPATPMEAPAALSPRRVRAAKPVAAVDRAEAASALPQPKAGEPFSRP